MAKQLIETYFCDVCKKSLCVDEVTSIKSFPVFFTTEQNEGREVKPYISRVDIDFCDTCLTEVLYICAQGAMGSNIFNIVRVEDFVRGNY